MNTFIHLVGRPRSALSSGQMKVNLAPLIVCLVLLSPCLGLLLGCASVKNPSHASRKTDSKKEEVGSPWWQARLEDLPGIRTPQSAKAYLTLAEEYHRQGRPQVASRLYQDALAADPLNAHARFLYAHALASSGELDNAIREAKVATKLAPDDVNGEALLGVLYRRAGRNEEALTALEKAWSASPPSIVAGKELAAWELGHDRPDNAKRILDVCAVYEPNNPEVQSLQAEALENSGDLVAASQILQRMVDRGEGGAESMARLANIREFLGQADLAKTLRQDAERLGPVHLASNRKRWSKSILEEYPPVLSAESDK